MKKITLILGLLAALILLTAPVAAAIGYAWSSNSYTSSNSLNLSFYAQPDELALVQISYKEGGAVNDISGVPDGWVLIRKTENSNNIGQALYWKSVGSFGYHWFNCTLDYGQSLSRTTVGITRFSGVDIEDPIIDSSGKTGISSNPGLDGISGLPPGSMIVGYFGYNDDEWRFALPYGMDAWNYRYTHISTNGPSVGAARDVSSGGDYTALTSYNNFPGYPWVAQLVALRTAESCEDRDGDGYAVSICGW